MHSYAASRNSTIMYLQYSKPCGFFMNIKIIMITDLLVTQGINHTQGKILFTIYRQITEIMT